MQDVKGNFVTQERLPSKHLRIGLSRYYMQEAIEMTHEPLNLEFNIISHH